MSNEPSAADSNIWESYAGGYLVGLAHLAIIEVAEGSLRRSTWTTKFFRRSPPAEQERLIIRVSELLARYVAEDYRRAAELGIDLAAAPTLPKRRQKKRRHARAARMNAIRRLTNAEDEIAEYEVAYQTYDALPDRQASPPFFSEEFGLQDGHRRYILAQDDAAALRKRLGVDSPPAP